MKRLLHDLKPGTRAHLAVMILRRQAALDSPERKLMFAAIYQGVRDVAAPRGIDKDAALFKAIQTEAGYWFTSGGFEPYADAVNLDPNFVMEILKKLRLLP